MRWFDERIVQSLLFCVGRRELVSNDCLRRFLSFEVGVNRCLRFSRSSEKVGISHTTFQPTHDRRLVEDAP